MKNGMVIIDVDGHAVDFAPVYHERLSEQYRNRESSFPNDNFPQRRYGIRVDPAQFGAAHQQRFGSRHRAKV